MNNFLSYFSLFTPKFYYSPIARFGVVCFALGASGMP
ncbi:hypothetical protein SBC2_76310 (plasmid) [Caballeronia sp. SBC2]|nr:hypothetical protein SBC2_76310 [Caballeronia sp. SBC2]